MRNIDFPCLRPFWFLLTNFFVYASIKDFCFVICPLALNISHITATPPTEPGISSKYLIKSRSDHKNSSKSIKAHHSSSPHCVEEIKSLYALICLLFPPSLGSFGTSFHVLIVIQPFST